jgi:hypothetical protein
MKLFTDELAGWEEAFKMMVGDTEICPNCGTNKPMQGRVICKVCDDAAKRIDDVFKRNTK